MPACLWSNVAAAPYLEPTARFVASAEVNHTVKLTSCDNRGPQAGGEDSRGRKCRWFWGMKSFERRLNRSHRAAANQALIGRRRRKSLGASLRPSREASGESWVKQAGGTRGGGPGSWSVCLGGEHGDVVEGQRWEQRGSRRVGPWVGGFLKPRPHKHHAGLHARPATHARTHTDERALACSAPTLSTLTLPHSHKT